MSTSTGYHASQLRAQHTSWEEENIEYVCSMKSYEEAVRVETLLSARCNKCGREMGEHPYNTDSGRFTCKKD